MIKKILVPYDGSKYSDMSLSQAREIAEKFDATIFLLMVIDEHELSQGMLRASVEADYTVADSFRKFIKSEVIKAKKIITKKAKTCEKKGIKVHHHAMKGEPTEAILDYAIANKVDLIIIGSKGLRGFSKLKALGSVSRTVSELAKCPVMIIR